MTTTSRHPHTPEGKQWHARNGAAAEATCISITTAKTRKRPIDLIGRAIPHLV